MSHMTSADFVTLLVASGECHVAYTILGMAFTWVRGMVFDKLQNCSISNFRQQHFVHKQQPFLVVSIYCTHGERVHGWLDIEIMAHLSRSTL